MTQAERRGASQVVVRRLHDADGGSDLAFWRGVPPHQKLGMTWDMVLEYLAWQHPDVDQPRLQRSVCRVERRRG